MNAALVRFEDGLQFALAAVPPGGVVPKFIDPRLAAGDGMLRPRLAVAGAEGVTRCLSLLIEELRLAMALVGANSLRDLSREVEWPSSSVVSQDCGR